MNATLYIVSTPIGNLQDITLRALEILQQVDLIAAEDTRHTGKLLQHFEVKKKMVSYHDHNVQKRLPEILAHLKTGRSVALVSDAGTPLINDPGFKLVREIIREGIKVVPIPGVSAVTTALVSSGLPPYPFLFLGYLPRKHKARRESLMKIQYLHKADLKPTLVAFESPHRLVGTLKDIKEIFGPDTRLVVAQEMTKMYETFLRGTVTEVLKNLEGETKIKGEVTLVW